MSISPICDRCRKELTSYGAILLGPPRENKVTKMHLCTVCYDEIVKAMRSA